jgi:tetratricopeptide (TPR) repeat protein
VLLGGVLCLGGWQVWLTLRLLEQDRHLELQRSHERLNQIADLALAQVTGNLKDWELGVQALNDLPAPVLQARFPKGATFITVSEREIKIYPKRSLLFTPSFQTPLVQEPGAFNGVDELEFREQQYDRAMALLTPLATRLATRAEALLRLARIEYKAKRPEAALDTYAKLITENAVTQSGTPYALSAISARCRILIALGRKEEAQSEASRLHAGLLDGRWPISRDVFELHWASLNSLGLNVGQPPQASVDFSTLVSGLFSRGQLARFQGSNTTGREFQPDASLLVWNARPDRLSAVIAPSDWLDSAAKPPAGSGDVHLRLASLDEAKGVGFTVTRSLAEVGIPGRLEFSSVQPISGAASSRRALFAGGAALMLIVILGA